MEYAKGGVIPKAEGIPLKLCNGYWIIDPAVEEKYGKEFLDKINEHRVPGMSIQEGK